MLANEKRHCLDLIAGPHGFPTVKRSAWLACDTTSTRWLLVAPLLPSRSQVLSWDEINQGLLASQASARISLETNWVRVDKNKLQTTGGNFGRKRDAVVFFMSWGFRDPCMVISQNTPNNNNICPTIANIAGLLLADYYFLTSLHAEHFDCSSSLWHFLCSRRPVSHWLPPLNPYTFSCIFIIFLHFSSMYMSLIYWHSLIA